MMSPPGALRLSMPEGARCPQICVSDQDGRWWLVSGVSRIVVECDARDDAGLPRMVVEFDVLALASLDLEGTPERTVLRLAGVDDAMIEAARAELERRKAADPA